MRSAIAVQQGSSKVSNNDDPGYLKHKLKLKLKSYGHPAHFKAEVPWARLVTLDPKELDRPGRQGRLAT